jgi:ligand-binding sensor domain-containing protein
VLWIGTSGGGLARFDTRTGDVERITTKNGLPNDVVYGVLAENDGRLWMSTNKGIARYDRKIKAFRNFTVSDGLQSNEFNRYAYCKDAKGRLWFGGVNGFNYFDPKIL